MLIRSITLLLCLVCSPLRAEHDSPLSAGQWLENATSAMKSLNYHGTVVFMKNDHVDTMKYRHTVEDGVETERLTSLNSPLRELVRKSNSISCFYKETQKKIESMQPIDRSFIVNLPDKAEQYRDTYLLAVAGREIIAMRSAQIIAVLPKDELRYARKIWIDMASWLPMKVEVYGPESNVLEQVLFTEFAVDTAEQVEYSSISAERDQTHRHGHSAEIKDIEQSAYRLNHWPLGFEQVFFMHSTMQPSNKVVDHLLISDGFSNISIYFEKKSPHSAEGSRSMGATNSFSRLIGDTQVMVLGEVPAQTLEFIASGIALRNQ